MEHRTAALTAQQLAAIRDTWKLIEVMRNDTQRASALRELLEHCDTKRCEYHALRYPYLIAMVERPDCAIVIWERLSTQHLELYELRRLLSQCRPVRDAVAAHMLTRYAAQLECLDYCDIATYSPRHILEVQDVMRAGQLKTWQHVALFNIIPWHF